MTAFLAILADRVLHALGNGVSQGLCLTAAVGILLRFARPLNAATRHALLFATLLAVVALPAGNLVSADLFHPVAARIAHTFAALGTPGAASARPLPAEAVGANPAIGFDAHPPLDPSPAAEDDAGSSVGVHSGSDDGEVAPTGFGFERGAVRSDRSVVRGESSFESAIDADPVGGKALGGRAEGWVEPSAAVPDGARLGSRWHVPIPAGVRGALVIAWLGLAGLRLLRLAHQCAVLARLRCEGQAPPARLTATFERLRQQMGIRRDVVLLTSAQLRSPIALGYVRPCVLVPAASAAMAAAGGIDWERLLRHELAHIARRDDWTNLIQQVAVAVFFFHPAVHWLSRRLTVDREVACDDHVLSGTGSPASRREYALFLTDFARRNRGRQWAAAPAAWSNPSQLKERIHMILDTNRNRTPGVARAGVGAGTLAIALGAALALYGAPRLALAEPAESVAHADTVVAEDIDLRVDLDMAIETEADAVVALALGANSPHAEAQAIADGADLTTSGPKPKPARSAGSGSGSGAATAGIAAGTVTIATPAPWPSPSAVPMVSGLAGPGQRQLILAQGATPTAPAVPSALPAPPTPAAPPAADIVRPAQPPRVPTAGRAGEIERRLDRLEQLVESLVGQREQPKAGNADFQSKRRELVIGDPRLPGKEWELRVVEPDPHLGALSRVLEQASRQIEEAARQAERAARDADKALNLRAEASTAARESLEARRRTLDDQRRAIEKQIAQIESQLGRLESHFDRVEAELDRERGAVEARAEQQRERVRIERDIERQKTRNSGTEGKSKPAKEKDAPSDAGSESELQRF